MSDIGEIIEQAAEPFGEISVLLNRAREESAKLETELDCILIDGMEQWKHPNYWKMMKRVIGKKTNSPENAQLAELYKNGYSYFRQSRNRLQKTLGILSQIDFKQQHPSVEWVHENIFRLNDSNDCFSGILFKRGTEMEYNIGIAFRELDVCQPPGSGKTTVKYFGKFRDRNNEVIIVEEAGQRTLEELFSLSFEPYFLAQNLFETKFNSLASALGTTAHIYGNVRPGDSPWLSSYVKEEDQRFVWEPVVEGKRIKIVLEKYDYIKDAGQRILGRDTDKVQRLVTEGNGYVIENGQRVYAPGANSVLDDFWNSFFDFIGRRIFNTECPGNIRMPLEVLKEGVINTNAKLANYLEDGTMIDYEHIAVGNPMLSLAFMFLDPRIQEMFASKEQEYFFVDYFSSKLMQCQGMFLDAAKIIDTQRGFYSQPGRVAVDEEQISGLKNILRESYDEHKIYHGVLYTLTYSARNQPEKALPFLIGGLDQMVRDKETGLMHSFIRSILQSNNKHLRDFLLTYADTHVKDVLENNQI